MKTKATRFIPRKKCKQRMKHEYYETVSDVITKKTMNIPFFQLFDHIVFVCRSKT